MARFSASLVVFLTTCVLIQHFIIAASGPVIEQGRTKTSVNEDELEKGE